MPNLLLRNMIAIYKNSGENLQVVPYTRRVSSIRLQRVLKLRWFENWNRFLEYDKLIQVCESTEVHLSESESQRSSIWWAPQDSIFVALMVNLSKCTPPVSRSRLISVRRDFEGEIRLTCSISPFLFWCWNVAVRSRLVVKRGGQGRPKSSNVLEQPK